MDMVRLPDQVGIVVEEEICLEGESHFRFKDVEITFCLEREKLQAFLTAEDTAVREVVFKWKGEAKDAGLLLNDHWERGYGDLEWLDAGIPRVLPWYFLDDRNGCCEAYGVKVRPGAMCCWEVKEQDVILHLDVCCGGEGVRLNGRKLLMAEILMKHYEGDSFETACEFCRCMCTDSICPDTPVYGSNNWYYAYGVSSREELLKDSAYLSSMTEGLVNRPFMVIDDGWQSDHKEHYNGGPWREGNADYGDMGKLACDMKACGVRPGIWFRPLLDASREIPHQWRLKRKDTILDISVPEVLSHIQEDIRRIALWGYELVKHDFSTYDIFGNWGFEMGSSLTEKGWRFHDETRTTAEIIVAFYEAIREAAGDMLILGCNCIGHLGAGLMQMNRTGDDTSGIEWERTRKMGVNTLAFRMPQHGAFFGADADCVGITEKIPWEKNRQWLQLLAASGTPLFVSVKPGILNQEQEEELKAAYRKAAVNKITAVPLDWKEGRRPEKWRTFEGISTFCW